MIENYPMFTMSIHNEETSLDLAMFMYDHNQNKP
jgi:hypothetical protein